MDRFTVTPWFVALLAGLLALAPTNVYKICAWNRGTARLDPWRVRSTAAVQKVAQTIRAWCAGLWSPRLGIACLALVLAIMVAHLSASHEAGWMAITVPVATLRANRAQLLREAEALKGRDGNFATDADRSAFDAKLTEIDGIDAQIRQAPSETIAERNPLDPGAPTGPGGDRLQLERENQRERTDADLAATAEQERITGIMTACRAARIPSDVQDRLIRENTPLVKAQAQIFEEMRKRGREDEGPRSGGTLVIGQDPLVHVRSGIENALLHRLAPSHFKLDESGRLYRGMNMLDVGRAYLQARGVRVTNLSKNELAAEALGLTNRSGMHTTSDFSNLLADVANKTLRRAYEEQPQTFAPLVTTVSLPDYKLVKRLQFGDAPALVAILEHGEYTSGTIGEGKEQYQLVKYGRKFAITREAIINDDTNAFARLPMMFGRRARVLESDLVWQQITSNPTMGDGTALFAAGHANLDNSGDEISVASLGNARASLRQQTSLDGALMNLSARYLVVPSNLETMADQFVTVITPQQAGSVNPFMGRLTVIADPRLDAASTVAWYVTSSPDQIDMIEIAYLEGEQGPQVESRVGFDVDGVEIKCRLDFGCKVLDWRGFYKNVGDTIT